MLGRNEFALRRGFACGKTLVRRKSGAGLKAGGGIPLLPAGGFSFGLICLSFWVSRAVGPLHPSGLNCSAEVNSACAKVFACGENACTAHPRHRPEGRWRVPSSPFFCRSGRLLLRPHLPFFLGFGGRRRLFHRSGRISPAPGHIPAARREACRPFLPPGPPALRAAEIISEKIQKFSPSPPPLLAFPPRSGYNRDRPRPPVRPGPPGGPLAPLPARKIAGPGAAPTCENEKK